MDGGLNWMLASASLNQAAHDQPVLGETMDFLGDAANSPTQAVAAHTPKPVRDSIIAQFFCGETDPENRGGSAPGEYNASPFCAGGGEKARMPDPPTEPPQQ